MPKSHFDAVTSWVFDLDNTLYSRDAGLFIQIERKMTAFVARELNITEPAASALRHKYWRRYGTTLAGMMHMHGTDPGPYLREVHDIDLSDLPADPTLAAAIGRLPGRRIVFTNGSRQHGENICSALGLLPVLNAIYGIEDATYTPKPDAAAFARVFSLDGLDPSKAAMFEDDAVNLRVPYRLGMRTVLVGSSETGDHIDHRTENLAGFLTQVV